VATSDALPCVLVAHLEPIARVGIGTLLDREPYRVYEAGQDVIGDAVAMRADAVVIGGAAAHDLGRRVHEAVPRAKVIVWSSDEEWIDVLDPGSKVLRRNSAPTPTALLTELSTINDRERK
jgi:hypothetical protein